MILLLTACVIETALNGSKTDAGPGDEADVSDPTPDTDTTDVPEDDTEDTASSDDTEAPQDTATPDDTAPPEDTGAPEEPCAAQVCPDAPTVTDVDGNEYATVQVGDQCWMRSNLRVASYRNGDALPARWSGASVIGQQAAYDNDAANEPRLGKLYNGYAVLDARGLCPDGWRVPTSEDFDLLAQSVDPYSLIGEAVFNGTVSSSAGGALKTTTDWNSPNTGATNSSCFSGEASGYRGTDGNFYNKGIGGYFWTTTEAFPGTPSLLDRRLWNFSAEAVVAPNFLDLGFPVRCVRE